jgi:hypothetical protein
MTRLALCSVKIFSSLCPETVEEQVEEYVNGLPDALFLDPECFTWLTCPAITVEGNNCIMYTCVVQHYMTKANT